MPEKYKKGDFIGEKYEVFDLLGEGGFGPVYLVYTQVTEEVLALKTYRDEYIDSSAMRERFRKEAQAWIDLERHPYIVSAKHVASISGRLYIAMEHIASDEAGMNTLDGFLKNRPPDLVQSLRWAIQFCLGMEHAHTKGIKAHSGIKPSNVMIDRNKAVRITDFGLAGMYAEEVPSGLSQVRGNIANDIVMQTVIDSGIYAPEYLSPEQFEDLSSRDARSDIYSFGILLYRMAAGGKLPFKAGNPVDRWATSKHFHQESNVPELASPLFPVILKCLKKKPGNRYQTFRELRTDLEPLLQQKTDEIVKRPESKELDAWELGIKRYAHEYTDKGAALGSHGKHQEAIACYEKALEIDPGYAEAWRNKAVSLEQLGKEQESIACFEKYFALESADAEPWHGKRLALSRLSKRSKVAGRERAFEIGNKDAGSLNNKGVALGNHGKQQDAIACYDQSLEIDPRYADAWFNKGNALEKLGMDQEAIACYDKALEIDPNDAMAWTNKGASLGRLGRNQEAEACYTKVLEIDPHDAGAWCNKGVVLKQLGKDQEALISYDKALEIDPASATAWFNKGITLGRLDKIQEAITCFEKTVAIDPKYAKAWYNKGVAEDRLDNKDAILSYQNFLLLASDPDLSTAVRKRLGILTKKKQ